MNEMVILDHSQITYTLAGRGGGGEERLGVKRKAYIYCFDDVILLFKSIQGGRGCLEITKFEHTYFMDDLFRRKQVML